MLLKTSLNNAHRKLNARMVDFGGWDMPVVYTNQIQEHHAVRQKAGLFDVSHMGEIMITGPQALDLVQKIVSRDISKMENFKLKLTVMCNENGGIIDDLMVYKYNNEKILLVVNAGTRPEDFKWILKYAGDFEVEVKDISDEITKLDIQGPNAQKILQKITDYDLNEIKRFNFTEILVAGIKMIVSRSGYTGEDGFEIYFDNVAAEKIWDKLLEIGKEDGLIPCGLGARDTLRTECGMMLYGHDIDTNMTPFESVYGFAVSLNKNFIGKEVLEKQKNEGTKKKLVGFEMIDRGIARQHYSIFKNGEKIGEVTSGTPSPTLNKNIGMGYVRTEDAIVDSTIEIQIRDNFAKAKIVSLPFYV